LKWTDLPSSPSREWQHDGAGERCWRGPGTVCAVSAVEDPLRPRRPRTFTFLDSDGELYLALWFDENAEAVRYLVVPFAEALLHQLETGQISVREALERPCLWVVDLDNNGKLSTAARTTLADLPQDELPVPGTMLWPSLEPTAQLLDGRQADRGRSRSK
jgi:hypothetical protein